jgi:glycosyltransferase involved in cell wall biosynthesis
MSSGKYIIRHFDLSEPIVQPVDTAAYYCVFWYKSIPLGERYISAFQDLTEGEFLAECLEAIWPTLLSLHHSQNGKSEIARPEGITMGALTKICEILEAIHPKKFPETCEVSVVICTRDRADSLKQCLTLLHQQITKPGEIIVVDNASVTNDTANVVALFPEVRYVREDRPGLDIARNTGAMEARRPIVAYTDDDTIPDEHWVYRIYETFKDQSAAAMTGLVIAASLETEAELIFEKYWPFNRGYLKKIYDRHFFHSTLAVGPPVWEIGAGANMAFRKEIFEAVGFFDERLDVGAAGCSGDSEMWYRILANGYSIVYNPLAVVRHTHRNSIEGLKKQLHGYMRGFTVAILIQYQRFGHSGNLKHLVKVFPFYYLTLLRKGFPKYAFQYRTLLSEMSGVVSGLFYYWKHRNFNSKINL